MKGDAEERPERLLSRLGIASRRQVAGWLAAGRLSVDGRVLRGGERIVPNAPLRLDGRRLALPAAAAPRRVILYHKPVGEIVSRRDPRGRREVFAALPAVAHGRWVAVGRLDFNTSGLILFTSDGDLAARLMHPRSGLERRYLVRVRGELPAPACARLLAGVPLDDGPARLDSCAPLGGASPGRHRWYRVSLREGRNREVRRLFAAVGLEVSRLKRTGFGPLDLPRGLAAGRWKELGEGEIRALARAVGARAEPAGGA